VIGTLGAWFKDEYGRTLILRGVNLGGSSKVPYCPDGATHIREGFYDHRNVSFVGRPFPLEEADEHLARLRSWGLTFLRLLVPWEAVEHGGPEVYDLEYLEYLYAVVRKAGEHGLHLFIDPHQDVWSRMSGGDGAPGWTFEAVGMDVTRFSETGAAIVHAIHGDPFPHMIWPSNYTKLAAATMFTLFFGGNDFAPRTRVDGEAVQEYLQRHYINSMVQVARRLKGLPAVVGYDTLNEPSPGYIGWTDLTSAGPLLLGESPSPFQSMLLGAGFPQDIGVWEQRLTGPKLLERRRVNPQGVRVWQDGRDCIWKEHGVWDVGADGQPRLLRPSCFAQVNGRAVDLNNYLRPFLQRYARAIRSVEADAIIFLEGVPSMGHPGWGAEDAPNVVNAAHWYDGLTLFTKNLIPWVTLDFFTRKLVVGPWRVRRSFVDQIARVKSEAQQKMGRIPTLVGEFGIPFDMQHKKAYRTGDFSLQVRAMDASFEAMDANLVNCTLWNYTADNNNLRGDQWNEEDLSIFSRDQQGEASRRDPMAHLNEGGRALPAVVRPCARATAGEPLRMRFDVKSRSFEFEFRHNAEVSAPTEIFLPEYQYPEGVRVEASDGTYEIDDDLQTLIYRHGTEREVHWIKITPH
jgi:hypothetical protein